MKVKFHLILEEGLHLEGEDPPSALDFHGEIFRFEHPVRYVLDFQETAPNTVLARGSLSTVVKARCVRTLEWFDLPLEINDFLAEAEVDGDDVDLTPQMREDILLGLPSHPISPGTQPLAARMPDGTGPKGGLWSKLDQLNIKTNGLGVSPRSPRPKRRGVPPKD